MPPIKVSSFFYEVCITGDAPVQLTRWTIGDISPRSLRLQRSRIMGGISLESRFILDRFFNPYPRAHLETMIERPVMAELIRNGQVAEEWELLPGLVSFQDIIGTNGEELVLRDAFGREQHLDVPTLLGGQVLLRKGVHDFSYNLGVSRHNFAQDDEKYADPAAIGLHRYGINDWFTSGIAFSVEEDRLDAGIAMGMQLGNHNRIDLETLYRKNHGQDDYGILASHDFTLHPFSLFFSYQYISQKFLAEDVVDEEEFDSVTEQSLRSLTTVTARFTSQLLGNMSLGLSRREAWEQDSEGSTFANLTYSRALTRHFSLSAGVRHQIEGSDGEDSFFLGLTFTPGGSWSRSYLDNASYRHDSSEQSHEIQLQKSAGRGAGAGYILKSGQNEEGTSFGSKYVYRHERAILRASLDQPTAGKTHGEIGISGSIVSLDRNLYLGRPVTDGFAVVQLDEVDGLTNVPIKHNNALVGRIDPGEFLVVPGILSHQENALSIYSAELPIDFISMDDKKYIQIDNRGGTAVSFTATRFTAVEGNVYFEMVDGKETELSSLSLEFMVNDEKRTSFIGMSGYFYLENLPLGEYVLRILRFEGDCEARFSVTESEKIVSSLGRIACRPLK